MKTDGNAQVELTSTFDDLGKCTNHGLTKLEYFAAMALQGLLANSYASDDVHVLSRANRHEMAAMAVEEARALISALNKEF